MKSPWIKVSVMVPSHPKLQRLEKRLGVDDGLGVAVRLWCWCASHYPDGEIPFDSDEAMERAAMGHLTTEADVTDVLCEVGLLDAHPEHYEVHDWYDHQQSFADQAELNKQQNAERQRTYRNRAKLRNVISNCDSNVTVTGSNALEKSRVEKKETETTTSVPGIWDQSMPTKDGEFPVTDALVATLCSAYPSKDVFGELRKAKAWLVTNPSKRKTATGMPRFLNGWLSRQPDTVAAPPKPTLRVAT